MNTEFEATFIDLNINEIREKLKNLGATLVHLEKMMKRIVFHPPAYIPGGWMRVRDEGDKITLTLKIVGEDKIENQKEIELVIDSFDEGVRLLETIGAKRKAYQETKREKWQYQDCEVTIDTWPGLEPFIEIESAESEDTVKAAARDLDLDYSQAIFGSVGLIYEKKLGIPFETINDQMSKLTFKNPPIRFNNL